MQADPNRMTLVVDAHRCTGCGTCVLVCSFAHDRAFSTERSRIRVWRDDDRGLFAPLLCEQCEDAPCIVVCPTGALSRNDQGIVVRNAVRCIGCNECMNTCPLGAITFGPNGWMKCDRCASLARSPICAEYCTAGALRWEEARLVARERAREVAHRRLESAETGQGVG
jgi:carbon-monoxide dehydrogenase iron sulfur subunit